MPLCKKVRILHNGQIRNLYSYVLYAAAKHMHIHIADSLQWSSLIADAWLLKSSALLRLESICGTCYALYICTFHIWRQGWGPVGHLSQTQHFLTLCLLTIRLWFCFCLLTFSKNNIKCFKKSFREHYQSVKRFGSRSEATFCRSWSGCKLFAEVIDDYKSRRSQESVNKTLNTYMYLYGWLFEFEIQRYLCIGWVILISIMNFRAVHPFVAILIMTSCFSPNNI